MKPLKNVVLFILYVHFFVSMVFAEVGQVDANACDRKVAVVQQYLENNADLNLREGFRGTNDEWKRAGPTTLLGSAVRENCVEAVRLLLEHGADSNLHCNDVTPLLINLVILSETATIVDETHREQARVPIREIRNLLLSNGAVCDNTPFHRRWFINRFREFLSSTNGHIIYVYCATNQITVEDQNSVQQFDLPVPDGTELTGSDLRPILAPVLEAQKAVENANALIIGVNDAARSVGSIYRGFGIPEETFAIPDYIVADAKTLTGLFLNHPDVYTEDMMKLLDEVSPQIGRMNPLADSEAELLAL